MFQFAKHVDVPILPLGAYNLQAQVRETTEQFLFLHFQANRWHDRHYLRRPPVSADEEE